MKSKHYAHALFESLKECSEKERDRRFDNFQKLLKLNGHIGLLPKIKKYFEELYWKDQARRTVEITTAKETTEKERNSLLQKGEYKEVFDTTNKIIKYSVDQNLVGGFKVQSRDRLIDTSYKAQLMRLYSKFID